MKLNCRTGALSGLFLLWLLTPPSYCQLVGGLQSESDGESATNSSTDSTNLGSGESELVESSSGTPLSSASDAYNVDVPLVSESAPTNGDACLMDADPGPCTAEHVSYFYDARVKRCRQFIYGGCKGNGNHFDSEDACLQHCSHNANEEPHGPNGDDMSEIQNTVNEDGGMLTLTNGNGETSFTFSAEYPFIQLKAMDISDFQLRQTREIVFEFRSPEAQGLLLYHTLRNPPVDEPKYELYALLEGGELKTVHVYGANETTLNVGKGLNRDRWHRVSIRVDPGLATLQVQVDGELHSAVIEGLDKDEGYGRRQHINSTLFIGGMNWVQDEVESSYLFEHFVGCLRNIQLKTGPELRVVKPLKATVHRDIVEGCVDKCKTGDNRCRNGGRCINRYESTACDCFGTNYEGDSCDYDSPTTITLRGYSYISYRIYDWKDRAHSESNRISLLFRALMGDSILFYAGGTFPQENHVAVTLLANSSLYVEVDFGDGPHGVHLGHDLTTGVWNNFTLIHESSLLEFILNGRSLKMMVDGPRHYLRFDPHIFVGGDRKPLGLGLRSSNNFVGCLSQVYFNGVSILHKLRTNSQQALYHSIFRPEIGKCKDVPVVPITFPFQESNLAINVNQVPPTSDKKLYINLGFRTHNATAVLAYGTGQSANGTVGLWELRLFKGELEFRISEDASNDSLTQMVVKKGQRLSDGSWHYVNLIFGPDDVSLTVDYRRPEYVVLSKISASPLYIEPEDRIVVGVGYLDLQPGFVGCVRDLIVNHAKLDPRALLSTANAKEISLDNCQLVDPCHRPNACEHGGLCNVDEGRVVCDCTGTGYTGKNCHFALYKRTCEELALLGYMKSGVYEIDIDGNGPHPPAHVRCEFEAHSGVRKTVVEHNLPRDTEIRSMNMGGDVVFNLTYREFSAEMLQSLISQSLQCKQVLRYDCYKAPLELHSYTWFRSAAGNLLDYLGKALPGRCPCSEHQDCKHSSVFCNCDADEPRWLSDEGYLTQSEDLGITQIFALQQSRLVPQSDGRITLGPLECVEANTQQYVVTFKSPDSYMEVPGWHRGDLAFSFRTSSERAILLYQPLLHPKHPYFRVLLVDDYKLTLEFSINGEPRSVTVKSSRDLNSGEWQQVWIDYNEHHVRFTVNQESILVDLNDGEEFGPFEATLFIGGAPEEMLNSEKSALSDGLVGCFRGLVMNNEVVNLYAYMNARFPDMIQKHCRPSCDPNPCMNGATCAEFWGSYKCICQNPLAHFGHNCETDINLNALTFRTAPSFVEANATAFSVASHLGLGGFFTEDILINIRTFDTRSLIFYAYDYHNNFVQLHIEDTKRIVFTFNSGNVIYDVATPVDNLATGQSIQIFIDRELEHTVLHVNGIENVVQVPLRLVDRYARDPWINKNKEIIKPPRPVRRPEEFYQVFLGGVDTDYMMTSLGGYTGCLRGLSVGGKLLDLTSKGADGIARELKAWLPVDKISLSAKWTTRSYLFPPDARRKDESEESGVMHNCIMLCDQTPCHNGGACLEDFRSNTYRCDCELTSYSGSTCTEEKGAHFRGDAYITANYASLDLDTIKIQLAFSTTAVRNIAQALLLIQTSRAKTKYILVSLTSLGYLRIEDDRGTGAVYGAEVKTINFLNGARHSVYYRRNGDSALLLVDKDEVSLRPLSASIHPDGLADVTDQDAIHIGGVRSSNDPRFADYGHFDGCISNIVVELDGHQMHPLLAYLGYQKSGIESVSSQDPEGIEEEARCAAFSITPPGVIEDDMDSDNDTSDQDWNPKPPLVLPYRPVFVGPAKYDPTTSNRILVGLGCIFLAGIIALIIYLCKTSRRSRRRQQYLDDEQLLISPTTNPRKNLVRNAGVSAPALGHVSSGLPRSTLTDLKLSSTDEYRILKSSPAASSSDVLVDVMVEERISEEPSIKNDEVNDCSVLLAVSDIERSKVADNLSQATAAENVPNAPNRVPLGELETLQNFMDSLLNPIQTRPTAGHLMAGTNSSQFPNALFNEGVHSTKPSPPFELKMISEIIHSLENTAEDEPLVSISGESPTKDNAACERDSSAFVNLMESIPAAIQQVTDTMMNMNTSSLLAITDDRQHDSLDNLFLLVRDTEEGRLDYFPVGEDSELRDPNDVIDRGSDSRETENCVDGEETCPGHIESMKTSEWDPETIENNTSQGEIDRKSEVKSISIVPQPETMNEKVLEAIANENISLGTAFDANRSDNEVDLRTTSVDGGSDTTTTKTEGVEPDSIPLESASEMDKTTNENVDVTLATNGKTPLVANCKVAMRNISEEALSEGEVNVEIAHTPPILASEAGSTLLGPSTVAVTESENKQEKFVNEGGSSSLGTDEHLEKSNIPEEDALACGAVRVMSGASTGTTEAKNENMATGNRADVSFVARSGLQAAEERRAPLSRLSEVYLSDGDDDEAVGKQATEHVCDQGLDMENLTLKQAWTFPPSVHVAETVRTFSNPLSYLGGQRLNTEGTQRSSKESVLSIDD